jgi:membrane-associated phospholipid phosphatase
MISTRMTKPILALFLSLTFLYTSSGLAQSTPQDIMKSEPRYEIPFTLIIGSFFLDKTVKEFSQRSQSGFNDYLFNIDNIYGDKIITSASLLGFYGISYLSGNEKMLSLSERAILSTVVTTVVVSGIKELVGRSRPYRDKGNFDFKPFSFKDRNRSFPSGHAAVTFAISTVFAEEYDNLLWKTFWYGSAATVAGARIYHNKHWLSDVIIGGAMGYYVAMKTSEMYKRKKATPIFGMAYVQNNLQFTVQLRF